MPVEIAEPMLFHLDDFHLDDFHLEIFEIDIDAHVSTAVINQIIMYLHHL